MPQVNTFSGMLLVTKGFKAVNASRPVDQVVMSQVNTFSGMVLERAELGYEVALIQDYQYFICLRRK